MMKQKNKFKNFWKENYLDSWNFLVKSKKAILAIIFVFFLFLFVGFFIPVPEEVAIKLLEFIDFILKQTEGLTFLQLFWFIFWNNLKVSFLGMLAGVILGVFSLSATIANGYLLGFVSRVVSYEEGLLSLWRIFPHGIFELPALFISLGLGLNLGLYIFNRKKEKYSFRETLWKAVKTFTLIVLPLLLVAAIIETSFISFFG